MAKITITIEDTPEGKVKVGLSPSCEIMSKMDRSGSTLTPAHGYAFCAINAIRRESKKNDPRLKLS